jgi:RHS repeat-associated protein
MARYYSSSLNRFMAADPESVAVNPYLTSSWHASAYVFNNPIRFIDERDTTYKEAIKNPRV